jgi:hypothetical protein
MEAALSCQRSSARQTPDANGASVAAGPKIACTVSGRFWAIALPDCLALTLCLHRCLHPAWIGVPVVPCGTGFHRPATSPASGPVRRLVGANSASRSGPFRPPGGSVTDCCRAFASVPGPGRSQASLRSLNAARIQPADCAAARCICGSPDSARRLPEACFPTLLRASLPDREAYVFPFGFNGFPSELQVRFHTLDT